MRQEYTANVWEETVIKYNGGLLKCSLPSFLGEFVSVTSWLMDDTIIEKNDQFGRLYAVLSQEQSDTDDSTNTECT